MKGLAVLPAVFKLPGFHSGPSSATGCVVFDHLSLLLTSLNLSGSSKNRDNIEPTQKVAVETK